MSDIEFIHIECSGYTDIRYKTKSVNKKITDYVFQKIEQLYDIKIKDKKVPIYQIGEDKYILVKHLYEFENISHNAASDRLKKMREEKLFIYPPLSKSGQEINHSPKVSVKPTSLDKRQTYILLRLPDVITYMAQARGVNKLHIIKKLIIKIREISLNELEFLWHELELFDRELYHKARKWGYKEKLWLCNTYRRMRRIRYRYDSLTSNVELPPLDSAIILHHNIRKYTDDVIKTLATKNVKWVKYHKKGPYKE